MATGGSQDGSEDVSDFLRRIKELGDAPGETDNNLEQEILESRRLREARRAERARSLSPDKQVPPNPSVPSPAPLASSSDAPFSPAQPVLSPTQDLNDRPLSEVHTAPRTSVEKPRAAPPAFSLARATNAPSPLRPSSRPVSLLGPRAQPSKKTDDSATSFDRADITQSLSQKDPSWFRQTADRGSRSAALRKSNDGDDDHAPGVHQGRRQLHGLAQHSSDDPFGSGVAHGTSDSVASFEGVPAVHASARGDTPVTSPTNFSASRDTMDDLASPTKGMGGFVQSAMLRRNESVSKRWSAQASAGLHRQNSSVSSGKPTERGGVSRQDSEGSDMKLARRSRSPTKVLQDGSDTSATDMGPTPTAHKRWSPHKSSWLESALNKPPESPRAARQNPSQPSWLSDLNKNRQSRLSKDEMSSPVPPSPSKQNADLPSKSDSTEGSSLQASKPAQPPAAKPKPARLSDTSSAANQEANSTQDGTAPSRTESPAVDKVPAPETNREATAQPKVTAPFEKVSRAQDRPKSVQGDQGELEFRSAFGKLKRAQTQNYQAPDELKDNIMRGKAGLATTGGPQKSERRDEFKESLLRQRASMSDKAAEGKATPARPISIDRKPPTPEAIAKRKAMGKSEAIAPSASRPQSSSDVPRVSANVPKPTSRTSQEQTVTTVADSRSQTSTDVSSKSHGPVGGKLAARFNPALANMIARGPPPPKSAGTSSGAAARPDAAPTESAGTTSKLDHVTKARARGPKRRPPKASEVTSEAGPVAATTAQEPSQPLTSLETTRPSVSNAGQIEDVKKPSKPTAPSKPTTLASSAQSVAPSSVGGLPKYEPSRTSEANPAAPLKPFPTQQGGSSFPAQSGNNQASKSSRLLGETAPAVTQRSSEVLDSAKADAPGPKNQARLPPQKNEQLAADRVGTSQKAQQPSVEPSTLTKGALTMRPTQPGETHASIDGTTDRPLATPGKQNVRSTPADSQNNLHIESQTSQTSQTSPKTLTNDASKTLADFFDTAPQAPSFLSVNVSDILSAGSSEGSGEFRTLDHEISVLSSDGKRIVIPTSQQAVLCNNRLYLIKHVMKNSAGGQRVEVYLWTGSTIAQAAVEDAQLFARKYAKESGGSLEVFPQGKEPAKLFQALGDTVITKRSDGSRDEPYMLCGRKHLKQYMAFDEVDFSLNSFSSGFPFIIAGTGPRVYLWKGKGCSMDELANAQMTCMNLSPSGEVVEVADGEEPAELLELFPMPGGKKPVKSVPRSADHWKLKSQHSNYCTRLFQVTYDQSKEAGKAEPNAAPSSPGVTLWNLVGRGGGQQEPSAQTAQQVKEISPFGQGDLEREQIYVLDAFFEIYVIVGPRSQAKADAFATALLFAQDYSILAAGSQDRPFVPVGTVVLQGAPRDLKACFRGWDESAGLFGPSGETQVTTGRSLRLVPLSAALVAVKAA